MFAASAARSCMASTCKGKGERLSRLQRRRQQRRRRRLCHLDRLPQRLDRFVQPQPEVRVHEDVLQQAAVQRRLVCRRVPPCMHLGTHPGRQHQEIIDQQATRASAPSPPSNPDANKGVAGLAFEPFSHLVAGTQSPPVSACQGMGEFQQHNRNGGGNRGGNPPVTAQWCRPVWPGRTARIVRAWFYRSARRQSRECTTAISVARSAWQPRRAPPLPPDGVPGVT